MHRSLKVQQGKEGSLWSGSLEVVRSSRHNLLHLVERISRLCALSELSTLMLDLKKACTET